MSDLQKIDRIILSERKAARSSPKKAARRLQRSIKSQVKSKQLKKGAIMFWVDNSDSTTATVKLSPILTSQVDPTLIRGNPRVWILLPDGEKYGFKRISKDNSWDKIRSRHLGELFSIPVSDGVVIVYRRHDGKQIAIYKIQAAVMTRSSINPPLSTVARKFERDLING